MFYFGAFVLVAADQITKIIAATTLPYGVPQPVLPFLRLTYVINTGAAFSLFTGFPWVLAGLAAVVATVIWWYATRRAPLPGVRIWPLLLIFSGAVGNLIDRLTRGGAVVDFLEFGPPDAALAGWWPVFNLADSMVVIGAVLFVLLPGRDGHPPERPPPSGPGEVDSHHQPPAKGEPADPQMSGPGGSSGQG